MQSNKNMKMIAAAILGLAMIVSLTGFASANSAMSPLSQAQAIAAEKPTLSLATTTSMQDSGLLAYILPDFEKACNCNVKVTAVGSGAAMKLGEEGKVDVVIAHSPAAEDAFMKAGHGSDKATFAKNYFVIVGPKNDPAGINAADNAASAFKKIHDSKATFVARGDNSGTANKEADIWKSAGLSTPDKQATWYKTTGKGMAETIRAADQQKGYTLSDKSTFLKDRQSLPNLAILVDATPDMANEYSVIVVNQAMHPGVNSGLAKQFLNYMTSASTQDKISQYGKETIGQPLYIATQAGQQAAQPGMATA